MFELSLGVGEGLQEFRRAIGLRLEVLDSWKPIFDEVVHPYVLEHMRKQFRTEGRHGGAPWAGYHQEPKYAQYRANLVGDAPILSWTPGNMVLRPSFTRSAHYLHVYRATDTKVTIGSSVPYAPRLNRGGTGPFGEAYSGRTIMAMKRSQKTGLVREVQRAVQAHAGKSGLRASREII